MLTVLLALLASAQSSPPSQDAQLSSLGSLGTVVFALDRAAWVATDALTAKMPRDTRTSGGWIIERAPDNLLVVTFFMGEGDAARAFFVADVRTGVLEQSRRLEQPVPLTPAQSKLARARQVAIADAEARGYRPCTSSPFNSVVVPTSDPNSPTLVYLLSAQTTNGTYPIGGHFRIVVSADGTVLSSRPFSRACLNLSPPSRVNGQKPAGMFVNHVLDATPTETHVFTSLAAGMPLFVGAGGKVWVVDGRKITLSDMELPAAPRE
jgi:hypothetical protein